MRIGIVSQRVANPATTLDDLVEEARTAEAQGFAFLSLPNIFGHDAIGALSVVGRETQRIELATGVVPSPPRHPVAMAQQALTAQAACRGRFVLGIGLSHKIVIENLLGLSYAHPAKQMREYLEVLMPLVQGKPAKFEGELYRVQASLQVAGGTPVPVVVAALGPKLLEIAGRLADGTATWMTGTKTLASHTVPVIRAAAKAAGRPEPRVIAALPIAIASDPAKAREAASKSFAIYGTLPSYRAMLDREGAAQPGDVALVGDEQVLRTSLRRLADAGVTHFAASLFPAEEGAIGRTLEFLRAEL
ncbi:MAG TPA: TIGR03564 family F420-dependent LLM class oxidoreductase [Myxococcota bacterium]|nr:TIGR03564 family F420-dependent LLM class oxidoreductase [Myxococcota bacterium]